MSLLVHRPLPIRPYLSARAFGTSLLRPNSLHIEKNDPELVADTVPAYPYGPAQWYKQSDKGLYGTARVQFGNNVGPKFQTKTRRTWHPNVVRKRLWSHALGRSVQIKVQTRVLRTIDKVGGLDEYLLGEKEGRIKELGMTGWWLRWAIMQTPHVKSRFAKARATLGLPEEGIESLVEDAGATPQGESQIATKGRGQPETIPTRRSSTFRQARLLKFRVGRGAHFVYTSKGWRRAKPDVRLRKRRAVLLRSPALRNFAANNMKKLETSPFEGSSDIKTPNESQSGAPLRLEDTNIMQQVLKERQVELTPEEEIAIRKAVAKALRAKQERLVNQRVEKPFRLEAKKKTQSKASRESTMAG